MQAQASLKSISDYADGVFEQLNFALSHCRRLGYPVRGGYAMCRVWENENMTEARYFVPGNVADFHAILEIGEEERCASGRCG